MQRSRSRSGQASRFAAVLGSAGALAWPLLAGEPVRFTDAPDPSPARTQAEQQRSVVRDGGDGPRMPVDFGSDRSVNVPIPPPYIAAPVLTPKEREAMERRRNWIFQAPETLSGGDGSVEDVFGVEAPRWNKEWNPDRRNSSSMTRFIERGPVARDKAPSEGDDDEDSKATNQNSDNSNQRQRRTANWEVPSGTPGSTDVNLPSADTRTDPGDFGSIQRTDAVNAGGRSATERTTLRPRFGSALGATADAGDSTWRTRNGSRLSARDFTLSTDAAASAASTAGGRKGAGDPVNLFPDLTREAVNPVTVNATGPGGAAQRPVGSLDFGAAKSPATGLRARFGETAPTGLGEGPVTSRPTETQFAPPSRVFKSPVALEMPTRRF